MAHFSISSMKKQMYVFSILLNLFFLPLSVEATGTQVQKNVSSSNPERVPVGKKQPHEVQKLSKKTQKQRKKQGSLIQKGYNARSEFTPWYTVKAVGAKGKTLTMNDETIWEISPRYIEVVNTWPQGSQIVIYPNTGWGSWLSSYDYRIYNASTGDTVDADLSQGPFVKYSFFITEIDLYHRTIVITQFEADGKTPIAASKWAVNPDSITKIRSWKNGQAVLCGKNGNGWFGPSHALINVNENEYVPASLLTAY